MNTRYLNGLICFRLVVLLFVFLTRIQSARCQEQDLNVPARKKYVERFTDYHFIWPVIKRRSTNFVIQSERDRGQKLTFRPNISYHAGAGVYIFGIGVQLLLALPADKASVQKYDESHALDRSMAVSGSYPIHSPVS